MRIKLWSGDLQGREHSEDLGVDGNISRKDLRQTGGEGVDCIRLCQDRDQWRLL